MKIAQIDECEIVNGNGVGVSLYVQGCPIHCKGCFNPETWDFNGGFDFTEETNKYLFELLKSDYITRFSILGGEPLYVDNLFDLFLLCDMIKTYQYQDIWLWTGYTFEQLVERIVKVEYDWPQYNEDMYLKPLLQQIDYIVCGPFIQEEKDLTLQWRGSRNQEVLLCSESFKKEQKIFYK